MLVSQSPMWLGHSLAHSPVRVYHGPLTATNPHQHTLPLTHAPVPRPRTHPLTRSPTHNLRVSLLAAILARVAVRRMRRVGGSHEVRPVEQGCGVLRSPSSDGWLQGLPAGQATPLGAWWRHDAAERAAERRHWSIGRFGPEGRLAWWLCWLPYLQLGRLLEGHPACCGGLCGDAADLQPGTEGRLSWRIACQ